MFTCHITIISNYKNANHVLKYPQNKDFYTLQFLKRGRIYLLPTYPIYGPLRELSVIMFKGLSK